MSSAKTMNHLPYPIVPKRVANRSAANRAPRREAAIGGKARGNRVEVFEIAHTAQEIIRVYVETTSHPKQPEQVIVF